MIFKRIAAAFALAAGVAGTQVPAAEARNTDLSIQTHSFPRIVPGLQGFCNRNPDDCRKNDKVQIVKLTPAILRQLESINNDFNRRITYAHDDVQYGRIDYWTYPDSGMGDCEDYAFAKRRALIALGWPPSSLLIATAIAETEGGHAVLVARTTGGDFVLDNRYNTVKPWHTLPYKWLSLQDPKDPRVARPINNGRGVLDVLGI